MTLFECGFKDSHSLDHTQSPCCSEHIIIGHHTCNLRVNIRALQTTEQLNRVSCGRMYLSLQEDGQISTSHSPPVFFLPPGLHFLLHISAIAYDEKERFMGLISIFFAPLTFNCGYLHRNPSSRHVKFMRSRHVHPWSNLHSHGFLDCLIMRAGWSLWGLVWFLCTCVNVISSLPSAGPSVLCDGVCERWRSHVPHPEVKKIRRAEGTFLHSRDHLRAHVPAWQRHPLQVRKHN